jgi:hypothetical protein
LFPLPKIRNKRASSRSQKATVLTLSEHVINIKNKKTEKVNKYTSSKNRIKKKGNHVLRSTKTQGRKMLTQNVCTAMGCIVKIEEVKYGFYVCSVNSWCHEECVGATKSRDLCVETVIKALKNMPNRTGRITGQSFNMAKIIFSS